MHRAIPDVADPAGIPRGKTSYGCFLLHAPLHPPIESSCTTRFAHFCNGSDVPQVQHLPLEEDAKMDPGAMIEARQRVAEGKVRVSDRSIQMAYAAWLG